MKLSKTHYRVIRRVVWVYCTIMMALCDMKSKIIGKFYVFKKKIKGGSMKKLRKARKGTFEQVGKTVDSVMTGIKSKVKSVGTKAGEGITTIRGKFVHKLRTGEGYFGGVINEVTDAGITVKYGEDQEESFTWAEVNACENHGHRVPNKVAVKVGRLLGHAMYGVKRTKGSIYTLGNKIAKLVKSIPNRPERSEKANNIIKNVIAGMRPGDSYKKEVVVSINSDKGTLLLESAKGRKHTVRLLV